NETFSVAYLCDRLLSRYTFKSPVDPSTYANRGVPSQSLPEPQNAENLATIVGSGWNDGVSPNSRGFPGRRTFGPTTRPDASRVVEARVTFSTRDMGAFLSLKKIVENTRRFCRGVVR